MGDDSFIPGSVCWIDVSSADPAGTRAFYAGLFGWTYDIDPDRAYYTTALLDGRPVAGLAGFPVPSALTATWTMYLASANVDYIAGVLDERAGQVSSGPTEVPGQGSVLIGADPTGASVGFWQPARPWRFHTLEPGSLVWAELRTRDGASADEFFATLFGYRQTQIGDGHGEDYTVWSLGEQTILGRLRIGPDWPPDIPAHWMLHFAVDPQSGTDAAVNRVVELGGRVDVYPYTTELGRIALVTDPSGAPFALIDPATRLQPTTDSARVDDPYAD